LPPRRGGPRHPKPAALISIDQGEELFAAENEVLAVLAAVLKDPPDDVDLYVILTIRADSKEALLACAAALGLDTPKPVYLSPMLPAAYRDVIVKPAEVYAAKVSRLAVDPSPAAALIADATGGDALPLLAFGSGAAAAGLCEVDHTIRNPEDVG
jgi:conflict system STAND superfamily ATPase